MHNSVWGLHSSLAVGKGTTMEKAYIEGERIWFPRRTGDHDVGIKAESITGVKHDSGNKNFSIVLYQDDVGKLRVYEPAKSVAQTLWGKGNFKKKKGIYMPK